MVLFLILLIGLPYLGYKLFTGVFDAATGYEKEPEYKPDTHIHHHHNTHNHLHVDKKDLENMIGSKKSDS